MFEGNEIDAQIEGVDVDFVPAEDMSHGTLTLSFVGAAAVRARDEFHNNDLGEISWTLSTPVPVNAGDTVTAPAPGLTPADKPAAHKEEGMVTITAHAPVEIKEA